MQYEYPTPLTRDPDDRGETKFEPGIPNWRDILFGPNAFPREPQHVEPGLNLDQL